MNNKPGEMDCNNCRDMIDDYLEGKLAEAQQSAFESHLQSCSECAELLRVQRLSDSVIKYEKSLSPGFFLTEKIMAGIEKPGESETVFTRILRPALLTLSVAAAIFAGVMIGSIYKTSPGYQVPVELTLMNDIQIESLDILASE